MTTESKKNQNKLTTLIEKIISTQIKKSEEPKTGASGTSIYVEHNEVIEKIKKDKAVLDRVFNQNA